MFNIAKQSEPNRTIDEFPADTLSAPAVNASGRRSHTPDASEHSDFIERAAIEVELTPTTAANEELARDLGYRNLRAMLEQTEAVLLPDGSHLYLTTDSDNYWVAWRSEPFYDIQRFDSRQDAIAYLQGRGDCEAMAR